MAKKSKDIIIPFVEQPLPPVEGTPENPPVLTQEAQPNTSPITHHDEPTQTEEPEAGAKNPTDVEADAGSSLQDSGNPSPIEVFTGNQIVSLSPAKIKRNEWSRVTYMKNVEGGVEITHQDELHGDDDSISISNVRTYVDPNARIIMSEEIGFRLETINA